MVADLLSRAPLLDKKALALQVAGNQEEEPLLTAVREKQRQDEELRNLINYLQCKELPVDEQAARQILKMDRRGFLIVKGILYYEGDGSDGLCLVVPNHLQQKVLDEQHDGVLPDTLPIRRCVRG